MTTQKILIQDGLTGEFYGVNCSSNPKGFITSANDEGTPGDYDFPFWTADEDEAFDFGSERLAIHEMELNDLTQDGTRQPAIKRL